VPKRKSSFRPGSTGACEAVLFEVVGSDEAGEATRSERFAAASLYEVISYLHRRDAEFRISSVQQLGLVVLLSGTPLS
jgi:hypothetical protein